MEALMRRIAMIVAACAMVFLFTNVCFGLSMQKVDDFADWNEYIMGEGNGNYTIDDDKIHLQSSSTSEGAYVWYALYPEQKCSGMLATIEVSNSTGTYGFAELNQHLATISNENHLQIQFRLVDDRNKYIEVRIREETPSSDLVKYIYNGQFGRLNDNKNDWEIGEPITIGYAIINKEVCFYAEGYDGLLKWAPSGGSVEYAGDLNKPYLAVSASGNSTIEASFSNIFMIHQ
jgi:hypothetical protein